MKELFSPGDGILSRRTLRRVRKSIEAMNLQEQLHHNWLKEMSDNRRYAVNDVSQALNLSANTFRGPRSTGALWGDCPWNELKADGGKGMTFEDDFIMSGSAIASNTGQIGQWSTFASTGAQVTDAQLEGGVIKIGSDGDNEGVAMIAQGGSFRFVTTSTLALNQKMWFEASFSRSSIAATKGDFFVGLMAPTLSSGLPVTAQPITTTDDTLMTAGDFFGFHSCSGAATRGGPTEIAVAFCLASGTINYPTNLTTLCASSGAAVLVGNTLTKVGFLFDPAAKPKYCTSATARQTVGTLYKPIIRFFVNGLETPAFLANADVANATSAQAFPTSFMTPVFAVMNTTGSSPPTMLCDWISVAQRANS